MILLVTFHSVGDALQARGILAARGEAGTVVPVPRRVSSSCGYALEAAEAEPAALARALTRAGLEWDALYRQGENGYDGRHDYHLVQKRHAGEEHG